jgi:hypothetical protein
VTLASRAYWLVTREAPAPQPEVRLFLDWLTQEATLSAKALRRKR